MGAYRWKLKHKCTETEVAAALKAYHFEPKEGEEGVWTAQVYEWKEIDLERRSPTVLEVKLYWAGSETTEIYYDYLLAAGYLMGQLSATLDRLRAERTSGEEDPEDVPYVEITDPDAEEGEEDA